MLSEHGEEWWTAAAGWRDCILDGTDVVRDAMLGMPESLDLCQKYLYLGH